MQEQSPIRVFIAASTPMLRAGLRALLASEPIDIVAQGMVLADAAARDDIDVIVVADETLLVDAARVTADEGRLSILVLAEDDQAMSMLRRLPLNGWGVVSPEASRAELRAAVQAVAQGFAVLPSSLAGELLTQRAAASLAEPLTEPLTSREREVLQLLSQGLSNKLIARALNISEHTVKFHVSSLFTKLNASSRTDAVSRGARQGLITL
ncbi:MAG TPA: response regulator transcription factor [Roseiflexaceae bacterium]|jgi:DNA-binding NarL/FixJ family response regulator|nr:response regulator transcription factor [Roseiflexaceae bacterium]